jgi:hypothetical protein
VHDDSRKDYLGWTPFHETDFVHDRIIRGYIVDPNRAVQRISSFMSWSMQWPLLFDTKREALDQAVARVYLRRESLELALLRAHECPEFSEHKAYIQDQIELCDRLRDALLDLIILTPPNAR